MRHISVFLVFCLFLPAACGAAEKDLKLPNVQLKPKHQTDGSNLISKEKFEKLTRIRTRPVRSPVTGQIVNVPIKEEMPNFEETDADLCPHPIGKVMVYTPIVLDPWSGFACYRDQFGNTLTAEDCAWIQRTLSPRLTRYLDHLSRGNIKIKSKDLRQFFNRPEHLPDHIRCEHALAFYTHKGAPASARARLAWLSAWAYRRMITSAVSGPYLMQPVRRVVKTLGKDRSLQKDMQAQVDKLNSMYRQKDRFSPPERQIIGIKLAALYDRMGLTGWCRKALESVVRECRITYPTLQQDPWAAALKDVKAGQAAEVVNTQRAVLLAEAESRLAQLKQEMTYLGHAAILIRKAMEDREYPANRISFMTYLVGEFERRREQFGASKLWLDAARKMVTHNGESDYVEKQLELLKRYYASLPKKPDLKYSGLPRDYALLEKQMKRISTGAGEIRTSRGPNGR